MEFRNPGFFDDKVAPAMTTATPQEAYVEFQGRCPVAHNDDGSVTLTTMEDIRFVNQSRDVLGNGREGAGVGAAARPLIPLDLDGEPHRAWRKVIDPVFGPKQILPLEPKVRQRARELLDNFADKGGADVFTEWCQPLPSSIFLDIMGVTQDSLPEFLDFVQKQTQFDESLPRDVIIANMKDSADRCYAFFGDLWDERQKQDGHGDDLIGWLIGMKEGDTPISRDSFLDIAFLLVLAGLDTVGSSLANILSYLARHPDQRQRLVDDPSRWPSAIEELLRYETTVTIGRRMNLHDMQLPSGTVLPARTMLNVSWSAANLDPKVFPEPLNVDFERSPNPHIAFANGWHRCLGSHLARMELRAALEEFHDRVPDYRLAPDTELVYSRSPRAPRHLPLVWT